VQAASSEEGDISSAVELAIIWRGDAPEPHLTSPASGGPVATDAHQSAADFWGASEIDRAGGRENGGLPPRSPATPGTAFRGVGPGGAPLPPIAQGFTSAAWWQEPDLTSPATGGAHTPAGDEARRRSTDALLVGESSPTRRALSDQGASRGALPARPPVAAVSTAGSGLRSEREKVPGGATPPPPEAGVVAASSTPNAPRVLALQRHPLPRPPGGGTPQLCSAIDY